MIESPKVRPESRGLDFGIMCCKFCRITCVNNALFLDVSSELFGLSSRGIKLREFGRWE